MSEPKRYSIVADFQPPWAKMHEFRSGDWVKWEEYARLRASSFVTAVLVEQYERVVKAGDAMAEQIEREGKSRGVTYVTNILDWQAAKEGKPSV